MNYRYKFELLMGLMVSTLLPLLHFLEVKVDLGSEIADFSIFTIFLIVIAHTLFFKSYSINSLEKKINSDVEFSAAQTLLSVSLLAVSTVTVFPGAEGVYWFGYGAKIVFIAILILPIIQSLMSSKSKALDSLIAIATYTIVTIYYFPSIIQPPWAIIDLGHTMYVLNEVMSPAAGNFPAINITTQYTSLLGYIFTLFFDRNSGVDQAVWFMTVLALCTIVFMLYPLMRNYPPGKSFLALLFTVPAMFIVKQNEDSYSGSIAALFSAIPIRLLFPTIIVAIICSNYYKKITWKGQILLGAISALAIINNIESGLVSTIAIVLVIYIINYRKINKELVFFAIGLIWIIITYFYIVNVSFDSFNIGWHLAFVGGFGKGFGSVAMPSFGLWVFVITFLYFCVSTSVAHILKFNSDSLEFDRMSNISIITLYWGLFGIGMLPYYINRSIVSGQLQFILLPFFICCAGLYLIVRRGLHCKMKLSIILWIVSIPPAVSIASITQLPSLSLAADRLINTGNPISKAQYQMANKMKEITKKIRNLYEGKKVGLFINYGAVFSQEVGLKTYLPVNDYADLRILSVSIIPSTCLRLDNDHVDFLITNFETNADVSHFLFKCNFSLLNINLNDDSLSVYVRNNSGKPF